MKIQKSILIFGLSLANWWTYDYRKFQENSYKNSIYELKALQNQLKSIQDDQAFLHNSFLSLQEISRKKFKTPENRLITGQCIEEVGRLFDSLEYSFEPERSLEMEKNFKFKVTKIVIAVATLLDTEVYDFIETLKRHFPGVLHLKEVNLILNSDNPPPYMSGKLVFEWYAMGEKE